jgi:hypothetical protein
LDTDHTRLRSTDNPRPRILHRFCRLGDGLKHCPVRASYFVRNLLRLRSAAQRCVVRTDDRLEKCIYAAFFLAACYVAPGWGTLLPPIELSGDFRTLTASVSGSDPTYRTIPLRAGSSKDEESQICILKGA